MLRFALCPTVLALGLLQACGGGSLQSAAGADGSSDAGSADAAADGSADVSDSQRKDSEPVDGVADLGAALDGSDSAIDGQPLSCHPPCAFTETCFRGVCIKQNGMAVGCRMATDPADSGISFGCDFALACALTPSGDFTCEPGITADTIAMPCNGGWCGTNCACTDPTHWTCTCYRPDAGRGN